ncbi:Cytochrome P450-like protein 64 [Elsinoe fawcettii]|nr:Cytochrome P450-like protein 64 [Elsinoe fawcettii]
MAASDLLTAAIGAVVLYAALKYSYRVTLNPLARFPGPFLGGITNLWAISYDVPGSDSLIKHLHELHAKYGPIVRVRPNELHIWDWDAYQTVFKSTKFIKDRALYNAPQVEGSILNILDAKQVKPHRDLYTPYFNKSSINALEGLVHEKLSLFLNKLEGAASEGKSVKINVGYSCLFADVVMYYCYRKDLGALKSPDFTIPLIHHMEQFAPMVPFLNYFPLTGAVMFILIQMLPTALQRKFFPEAASMGELVKECHNRVKELATSGEKERSASIFGAALNPKPGQFVASLPELSADAVLFFLAGTDTSSNTLTAGTWGLLQNPDTMEKLQAELVAAIPDVDSLINSAELEKLPYLRGVVKESLRMGLGACARLSRIVPAEGATLCGQHIAGGTAVSFSAYVYNYDPDIFTDPFAFRPERWLVEDTSELDSRMISFSKGPRSCLGINLANAEVINAFAHVFRRFQVTNAGTTEADMDFKDCFTRRWNGPLKVNLEKLT